LNRQNSILKLRFEGKGITPWSFTAKELGELLIDLQKSMSSIAEHFGDKDWTDSDQILSLVTIENRSNSLRFASGYPKAPDGYALMIHAAKNKHLHGLPRNAFDGMMHISRLTKKKKCNAELSSESLADDIKAVITPDDTLIIPEEVLITDTKDFYGEITRVGGSEPKVRFRTFGGTLYDGVASKELTQKIAEMLYQTVKIKTEIKWEPSTSQIENIKIINVEPYEVQSNTELFGDLRQSLGDYSDAYGSDLKGLMND
jgi:hypothetical protein